MQIGSEINNLYNLKTATPPNLSGGCFLASVSLPEFAKLRSQLFDVFIIRPKKNICLFPICCHFNQWVGREFILFHFLFYFLSLQPIDR